MPPNLWVSALQRFFLWNQAADGSIRVWGCKAALLGIWLANLVRLPAASIIGPLLVSATAHATGLFQQVPPIWLVALAQFIMGSSIGARFAGFSVKAMGRTAGQGLIVGAVMTGAASAIALAAGGWFAVSSLGLMLALAPGGMAEMCLIAVALGVDPAFVTCMHVVRLLLVIILAPVLYRLLAKSPASQ